MKLTTLTAGLLSIALGLVMATASVAAPAKHTVRFQINNGLVKDSLTGLIWTRCSLGQKWNGSTCQGQAALYKWEDALEAATNFTEGKFKNWRVPTHTELKTLVACSSGERMILAEQRHQCRGDFKSPTINPVIFPQTPRGWFWTSTYADVDWFWSLPFKYLGQHAWEINFDNGFDTTGERTDDAYVRLVRDDK